MSVDFGIVNLREGSNRAVTPFLLNNDAFPVLENAYLFRGRIQRRSCFFHVGEDGRLKGVVGTTDGAGSITLLDGTVSGGIPSGVAQFVINGDTLSDPGGASPVALLSSGPTTGTLNRATGVLTTNAIAAPVTYFPGLPVMGLRILDDPSAINDERLIAFDTRYSYLFNSGTNVFDMINTFANTANTFVWTGTDSDLFWTTNYFSAFWATNNNAGFHAAQNASPVAEKDGIRWYGTVSASTGWRNFNPGLNGTASVAATQFLTGGLIILPYKNRLVVLNTLEGPDLATSIRYPQRARWCQNGTPFYGDFPDNTSAETLSWSESVIGRGGWVDAPTGESIVSAEFIKDTLVVYFERSTWQLVYTQNPYLPFVWQKINTELGAESTFSQVPFDRGVYGIGNDGVITTDSVNVVRIDQNIPDEVFNIQNKNNGVKRVYGIRDYTSQLVYWTIPVDYYFDGSSPSYEVTFPNKVLLYNYLDGSWAEFKDSFTCFGYWQQFSDLTWATYQSTWESSNLTWSSSALLSRFNDVIAGNQRGFVFIYSQMLNIGQNATSLTVSNITAATRNIFCPDHNLVNGDYIMFSGITGITSTGAGPNDVIYKVISATVDNFVVDVPPGTIDTWSGTYEGGGFIQVIPNIFIQTKEFNPFYQSGKSVRVNYIDVMTDRTDNGEFTANFYTSSNEDEPIEETIMPTFPEPPASFSAKQTRIWHRIYSNAFGSFFQNVITLSDAQMRDLDIQSSDIRIHALLYHVNEAGRVSYDL